jgi:hypothetical protein
MIGVIIVTVASGCFGQQSGNSSTYCSLIRDKLIGQRGANIEQILLAMGATQVARDTRFNPGFETWTWFLDDEPHVTQFWSDVIVWVRVFPEQLSVDQVLAEVGEPRFGSPSISTGRYSLEFPERGLRVTAVAGPDGVPRKSDRVDRFTCAPPGDLQTFATNVDGLPPPPDSELGWKGFGVPLPVNP